MPLRFTFRQLEYLVAVGEAGTIAGAAERLGISSPSISAAVANLEAEFAVQLFVRHHAQGLSLTPGGRRVFNEAKRILGDATALNDLAGDIARTARGPLSIGALTTVAPLLSATLRRTFEAAYPGASVSLREGHQMDLLRMLGRAEIDVAITYDLDLPKDHAFERLVDLAPYAMLPSDHRLAGAQEVSLKALAGEGLVLLDLPLSRDYFLSLFEACGIRPNIAERTTDMSVARSLVANGYGFGLANIHMQSATAPDGEALAFRPLSDDLAPLALGLVTKQTEQRSRIVAAFFEHAKARVATGTLPGIRPLA